MSKVTDPSTPKTRSKVLHALLAQGAALHPPPGEGSPPPLRRGEFWKRSGVDRDNGRQGLQDLQEEGIVEKDWRISPKVGVVLALSLGTESARGALVGPNSELLCAFESPPLLGQLVELSRTLLLNRLAELAHAVLEAGLAVFPDREIPLIGVSVAWPAPLGAVTKEPSPGVFHHPEWENDPMPVTQAVAKRLRLDSWAGSTSSAFMRSHAVNDANAAAVSAAFKKTRERALQVDKERSGALLLVRVGGGIGGGIVLLSKYQENRSAFLTSSLVEGTGYAGEIGHLPLGTADVAELGPATGAVPAMEPLEGCGCGREICLDSVASARAVVSRVRQSKLLEDELRTIDHDTEAMRMILCRASELEDLREVFRQAGRFIGRSLAGPIMLLNPSHITVTGSLSHPDLMEGIEDRRGDWKHVDDKQDPEMELLQGHVNKLAAAHGAGLVVLREKLFRRFDDLKTIETAIRPYTEAHLRTLALTLTNLPENRPTKISGSS